MVMERKLFISYDGYSNALRASGDTYQTQSVLKNHGFKWDFENKSYVSRNPVDNVIEAQNIVASFKGFNFVQSNPESAVWVAKWIDVVSKSSPITIVSVDLTFSVNELVATGSTYGIKDSLKGMGFFWDGQVWKRQMINELHLQAILQEIAFNLGVKLQEKGKGIWTFGAVRQAEAVGYTTYRRRW